MNIRKNYAIIISVLLLFFLTACSNSETPPAKTDNLGDESQIEQLEQEEEVFEEKSNEESKNETEIDIEEDKEIENVEDTEEAEDVDEQSSIKESEEDNELQSNVFSEPKEDNDSENNDSEQSDNPKENLSEVDENEEDKPVIEISGTGVETSIKISLEEMKEMKDYYFEDDFFSLNSFGTTEYFSFKGIRIKGLLEKAKIKEDATSVKFIASDGYEIELSIEEVLKEDYIDEQDPSKKYPVIIAWHENGSDYDEIKGLPFRLVIGQKEPGDVNKPQWVQNIAKIIID